MNRHWMGLLCAGAIAVAAMPQTGSAQRFARHGYPPRVARSVYQSAGQPGGPQVGGPAQQQAEELPPGTVHPGQSPPGEYADPFVDEPYEAGGFEAHGGGYYGQDYGDHYGGSPACGDACGEGWQADCGPRCYVVADYLHVEAGFSEALAFVDNQFTTGDPLTTSFDHQNLDFDFTSSYRLGGGYRIGDCGEEVRFMYTRLRSAAESGFTSEFVGNDPRFLVPYKPPQEAGGRVDIDAEVDVHSFDWDIVKTMPLGCKGGCDCGDPCTGQCGGCCDPCTPACPLWDFSWSLGVRYADADWYRRWSSFNNDDEAIGGALSVMDFSGVGPKLGAEGRRYFFDSGWFSAYAKGEISLLWGELEFESGVLTDQNPSIPGTATTVSSERHQVIPVTDIEAGFTAQVTCQTRFSGGYLVSAWHDLGFRDEFLVDPELTFPFFYDDANILGFHGWFFRAEVAY
jgi:hypothetical protein